MMYNRFYVINTRNGIAMISASVCGPLCQHPGCWKAKCTPPPPEDLPPRLETPEQELPTLSIRLEAMP